MQAVPQLFEQVKLIDSPDTEALTSIVDRLHVRVTGTKTWRCDALACGIVYVSKKTLEVLWAFVYSHLAIYLSKFQGLMVGGDLGLEGDAELLDARQLLTWARSEEVLIGAGELPDGMPVPTIAAHEDSIESWSLQITLRALQFHLFHELAHVFLANEEFPSLLELEAACDQKALDWITLLPSENDLANRRIHTGATAALLYIAAFGINTGRIDGLTHPRTYDRMIDALGPRFDIEQDHVWAFAATILAVHATNEGISIPPEQIPANGFGNFFECVQAYRNAIHAHANTGDGS